MTALMAAAAYKEKFSTAGEVLGLIALGIFLIFSAWIVWQRLRAPRLPKQDTPADGQLQREDSDV